MEQQSPPSSASVILPTFNRSRYIRAAISSVLEQSCAVRELIVIDDGSTDDTAAVCAQFEQQVRYVRQPENRGKTAAINRGLALATSEYIWIMDDDDIAPPDALERLLQPLKANPKLGFSYGPLQKFTEDELGRRRFDPPQVFPARVDQSFFSHLMEDCFITGQPCVLVRRACFEAIAPLNEHVFASVDYNILLQLARRYDAACVDKVVLWQRQHGGVRGPKADSYSESERVQRWIESDGRLLRQLLQELRLAEYLGLRDPDVQLAPLQRRQALFQKASIAVRKKLWDVAVEALTDAFEADDRSPLTPPHVAALRNMLGCRYGIDEFIFDPVKQDALVKACGRGPLAAEVRRIVGSRLTYWMGFALKQGDFRRFWATCCALVRVSGVSALRIFLAPMEKRLTQLYRASEAAAEERATAEVALGSHQRREA